jgi:predicted pyridoxine 5'-phosphate oxidase superfamily flavin-nucleotide-binding protein
MIVLTEEMKRAVNAALEEGHPVISGSVDAEGQPSLMFIGSTQVYDDDQLAVWVRNPEGGFLRRITANPRVAMLYRNPAERVAWQFHGRARVVEDQQARDTIYESANKIEQDRDPERLGVAVVIDLDRVIERGAVLMERE